MFLYFVILKLFNFPSKTYFLTFAYDEDYVQMYGNFVRILKKNQDICANLDIPTAQL